MTNTPRKLGGSGINVSPLGLGCMGMSWAYGPTDEAQALRVLARYVELSGNFLDTAEIYGPFDNELLVGKFLKTANRKNLVIATKFGFKIDPVSRAISGADSSPGNINRVCEASLKRLGIDTIDLFYQHRVDPGTPIEDTIDAMAKLIKAGKIRAIGMSEASPATLRRAAKIHPIAALQTEYSLWTRDPENNGVLAACREFGITFIPYSPLGRGFLTGAFTKPDDLAPDDWRRGNPRFAPEAFAKNLALADHVKQLAQAKGCTPAQLALAWVLAQGSDIVPIPGTKRVKYLEDNMGATSVTLTPADLKQINSLFPPGAATGDRYPADGMKMVHG